MQLRLAFATAIATAPDILIIDEALAVGDAVFQHRCLRRIKGMQESGSTILFVSHDPAAVRALCNRAILLNNGQMVADGAPTDVLNRYQKIIMAREQAYEASQKSASQTTVEGDFLKLEPAPLSFVYRHGDRSAEILQVELLDASGERTELVETGRQVMVRIRYVAHADLEEVVCGFLIRNRHGIHIYGTNTELQQLSSGPVTNGQVNEVTFEFNCWTAPDLLSLSVAVHSADAVSFDWLDGCVFFRVMAATSIEGVANLNATATMKKLGHAAPRTEEFAATGVQL
jgi:hypothetical protein